MMNSNNIKPGSGAKPGQSAFSAIAGSNQSILLEKLNVRRSTPDSEALASSDDEVDPHHRPDPSHSSMQPPKPVRRASWLNDTTQITLPHPRKGSFASSSMSPTASHPTTPATEAGTGPWGAHPSSATLGRHQPPTFSTWGAGIWNTERKEPPSRLSEVLPSPTSTFPPGVSSPTFFGDGSLPQASTGREQGSNPQIPFPIPLHPTPKTYRSQSYSVGQLDPDTATPTVPTTSALSARSRPIGHPGLQHRPSRPSMLSEMSSEGAMLGKVKEVEDDEDGSSGSSGQGNHQQQSAEAKTIELLARENAMLRQQHQQQQYQSRIRPRASTAAVYGLGNGYSVRESVPEESDYAIDELDGEAHEGHDAAARRGSARRMSEYAPSALRTQYPLENRKLENVKRAYWTSSLGFGGLGDIPQSRRHSFADVPTRQASIGSLGEAGGFHESQSPDTSQSQEYGGFHDGVGLHTGSPGTLAERQLNPIALKTNDIWQSIIIQAATYPVGIRQFLPRLIATPTRRLMGFLLPTLTGHPHHTETCMG